MVFRTWVWGQLKRWIGIVICALILVMIFANPQYLVILGILSIIAYIITQGSLQGLFKKIVKSIGVILLTFVCTILAIGLTGKGNEQIFIKIAAFSILVSIVAIWKQQKLTDENELEKNCKAKSEIVSINCPKCGRSLKGATQEMIGDTGICPKCKAEFIIEQKQ